MSITWFRTWLERVFVGVSAGKTRTWKSQETRRQRPFRPQLELLEDRCTPANLLVRTNVDIGPVLANQNEATIAINPVNPNNLVAFSNDEGLFRAFGGGLFSAFSMNAGKTWTQQPLFTAAGPTQACCDPQATFDQFGNLFLTYLTNAGNPAVATSVDGGQTFTVTVLPAGGGADQPSIAVGPGPVRGQGSVWVSYFDGAGISARGALVTGLGVVGAFGPPEGAPGSIPVVGNFGDIAVGPKGQVMVTYMDSRTTAGPTGIFINVDPDGLGPAGFGPQIVATNSNVGGFRLIPPQSNNFGIDAEPNLAWDRSGGLHSGRVYLVYTDAADTVTNNTKNYVRFSDNNGQTWSAPVRVDDDHTLNSHFLPSITVDQATGSVGVAWYDSRNDPANLKAQLFVSVSINHGLSFLPNVAVSAGMSLSAASEPPPAGLRPLGYGDFEKDVSFFNNVFYPVWADNSNSTGNNPNGTLSRLDLYTAAVSLTSLIKVYNPLRYTFNAATGLYGGFLTLFNASQVLSGAFLITFPALPPGVTLANASGTIGGVPFIRVNGSLPPLGHLHVQIFLRNPLNVPLGNYFVGFPIVLVFNS